jgi:hypothetical protein
MDPELVSASLRNPLSVAAAVNVCLANARWCDRYYDSRLWWPPVGLDSPVYDRGPSSLSDSIATIR